MLRKLLVPLLYGAMVVLGVSAPVLGPGAATAKADPSVCVNAPFVSVGVDCWQQQGWQQPNWQQSQWQPNWPPQQQWLPDWWGRAHYDAKVPAPGEWNTVWFNGRRGPILLRCDAPDGWYLAEWQDRVYWVSPW